MKDEGSIETIDSDEHTHTSTCTGTGTAVLYVEYRYEGRRAGFMIWLRSSTSKKSTQEVQSRGPRWQPEQHRHLRVRLAQGRSLVLLHVTVVSMPHRRRTRAQLVVVGTNTNGDYTSLRGQTLSREEQMRLREYRDSVTAARERAQRHSEPMPFESFRFNPQQQAHESPTAAEERKTPASAAEQSSIPEATPPAVWATEAAGPAAELADVRREEAAFEFNVNAPPNPRGAGFLRMPVATAAVLRSRNVAAASAEEPKLEFSGIKPFAPQSSELARKPELPTIVPAVGDGEELWSGHVVAHRWDQEEGPGGAFMIFAPFESARMKLTLLRGRPRLLLRVGAGIAINCWVDQLGNLEAVGVHQLRLFAPSLHPEITGSAARNLWLFTFHSHQQLVPQQRLAWAKVCQSGQYADHIDTDAACSVAEMVGSGPASFLNAPVKSAFMRNGQQYARPARDRLLGRMLHFQSETVQLWRSLSAQERHRAAAAEASAKAAQQEAEETAAQLAAVEAAVAALGSQAALVRSSSEVSSPFKQQTSRGSSSVSDMWKQLCLVGTAWTSYEEVHQHPAWDFGSWLWEEKLPRLLEQRSAGLHWNSGCNRVADKRDHNAFVFATTEPQLVGRQVVEIPVLVIIIAPPEWIEAAGLVALTSVQMAELELLPLAELGMEWRPLDWQAATHAAVPRVHGLHSHLHWSTIRGMGAEQRGRFEYAIMYTPRSGSGAGSGDGASAGAAAGVQHPQPKDDVRRVSLVYQPVDADGVAVDSRSPIDLVFDKDDGHRLRTFIPEFLEDEELEDTPQQREALEAAIREAFRRARAAESDRLAQLQRVQDQLSDAARMALAEQFVVKAYPRIRHSAGAAGARIDAASIKRYHTRFVNRFLGNADCVI